MNHRSTPTARRALGIVGALLVAGSLILWAFTWAQFTGLDVRVYRMGGQAVVDGDGSLYTRSFGEGEGSLLFTYPPFAALAFTALTLVDAETGAILFVGASILVAAVTSVLITRRLGGARTCAAVLRDPRALPVAIIGTGLICLLGPWRETMAFSQVNILLFAMIGADLLSGPRHRAPTGLLTGIAAGIKLTPLVFGLYFLVRGEWKHLLTMIGGFLGTIAVGSILLPAESRTYWLRMLRDTGRIGGDGYVDNLSVRGALLHITGPGVPVTVPWLLICLLLVAAAAHVIRSGTLRGDQATPIAVTALLMLLISPISWSHHWVWIVVVLAVLAAQALRLPAELAAYRATAVVLFVLTLLVFVQSPKTIGLLLGAADLDSQESTGWLIASSAGVFCSLAVVVFWVLLARALRNVDGPARIPPGGASALRGDRPVPAKDVLMTTGTLLAVCRVHGLLPTKDTVGVTAIDKRAVRGPVPVHPLGLNGDVQASRKHHGGPLKAVYAYGQDDADFWAQQLDRDMRPGMFGENLRIDGIDVSHAVIGERWSIGEQVVLEVTMPRTPCMNFARFLGERSWVRRFAEANRVGTYLRVVTRGSITAGDTVLVHDVPAHGVTSAQVFAGLDREQAGALLAAAEDDQPILAPEIRRSALRTLRSAATG